MPSHKDAAQLAARGYPPHYWAGNDAADALAKWHAQQAAPSVEVLRAWKTQRDGERAAMQVIAERQRQCLMQRARLGTSGTAATTARKGRTQKKPALPPSVQKRAKRPRVVKPQQPGIELRQLAAGKAAKHLLTSNFGGWW